MNKKISLFSFCAAILLLWGCKKNTGTPAAKPTTLAATVLASEAKVVLIPTYITLANATAALYNGTVQFQSSPTQANLANCRQLWLTATADYEQSAASLFGAGGALGADPASLINTYPIDTGGINSIINSAAVFTQDYIDSLPSYLTGFHGMEFELYGINGDKTALEFTPRQLSYITAVSLSIAIQTAEVDTDWSTSFVYDFENAGNGSAAYATQYDAFSDLTMAIANITETDAIYKFEGIYNNKSVILQESPFANNSIADIANNLIGVQSIYYGQYGGTTGTGLTAYVSQDDVSLDLKIKTDLKGALTAVNAITVPLSQAIYSQPDKIEAAAAACDTVDEDLKGDLLIYFNSKLNH